MEKLALLLVGLLIVGCGITGYAVGAKSVTQRAWEARAVLDDAEMRAMNCEDVKPPARILDMKKCKEGVVLSQKIHFSAEGRARRWQNFLADIPNLPKTQDVTAVRLGKTIDGGNWVVTLTDVDGKEASFWLDTGLDSGGQVRAITPY